MSVQKNVSLFGPAVWEHIYECLVLLYRKTLTKERKSVTYHFRVSNLQRYMFNHWPINNERNIISFLAEKYYFQALYFQQEKKDISFVDNQSAIVAETFHFMYEWESSTALLSFSNYNMFQQRYNWRITNLLRCFSLNQPKRRISDIYIYIDSIIDKRLLIRTKVCLRAK